MSCEIVSRSARDVWSRPGKDSRAVTLLARSYVAYILMQSCTVLKSPEIFKH